MGDGQPSSAHDSRSRRSIERLREALLELVRTKPYEQISVREIAREAGVSVPTFYRYFNDKNSLFSDIATTEIDAFMAVMLHHLDDMDPALLAKAMCDYILSKRAIWRTLLTSGATTVMREEFIRLSREVSTTRGQINPQYPQAMIEPFVASGIFEILSWWLSQDNDYPRENVAHFLDVLVLRPTITRQQIAMPNAVAG